MQTEGRHHARIVQSLVSSDLGNCQQPNILLDDEGLKYAILDPKNKNRDKGGILYNEAKDMHDPIRAVLLQTPKSKAVADIVLSEAYDKISPDMGELTCRSATVVAQYMCSIPVQKSIGPCWYL